MNLGNGGGFPPLLQADETFGLAGKVVEGELQGLKPVGKARGAGQAIGRRRGNDNGPGCWKQGTNPGIIV